MTFIHKKYFICSWPNFLMSILTLKLRGVVESKATANLDEVVDNWQRLMVRHRAMTSGCVNRGLTARRDAETEAKRATEARRVIVEEFIVIWCLLFHERTERFESEEKNQVKTDVNEKMISYKFVFFVFFANVHFHEDLTLSLAANLSACVMKSWPS